MPACADQELMLGGLVDGELDAANTALLEAHVARCDGCREEVERLHALGILVGIEGVRHRARQELHHRILSLPELSVARPRIRNRLPGWLAPFAAGAIAASLALATFVNPVQRQGLIDEQIVSSHVRSLQPGHLTDVQTTNEHVVKPWFNGRIDFAPPVPELADQGFPLAGGRLDSIAGRTVAAIVYHRRLHTVNVFIWRDSNVATGSSVRDGFSLAQWTQGGLRFAAISDIPPSELQQFEALYRQRSSQVSSPNR